MTHFMNKKMFFVLLFAMTSVFVVGCTANPPASTTAPTAIATEAPTEAPTAIVTEAPTEAPTAKPTEAPTAKPTEAPTAKPTEAPTAKPTEAPTAKPTEAPTAKPTEAPTAKPTDAPTAKPTAAPTATKAAEMPLILTLEQLAQFDGKDGRKAYVAVDGNIYDMSNSSFWRNGAHNGNQAGADLTDVIKNQSPHGVANLERVPKVGRLSQGMDLTKEELAKFDGKGGNKAYIAVNGIIYDVTENKSWTEGMHKGFSAGQDLTEQGLNAPHGLAPLEKSPVVGLIKN